MTAFQIQILQLLKCWNTLETTLEKNISLKNLSDKACMSTTSFYRFFKEN
jgi:transcriptional regulator GlxA family with amidase domain